MHLEVKMPQNKRNEVFSAKQVSLLRLEVKMLKERYNGRFRRCKATKKVGRLYLELHKLKISREWGTECLKTKNQRTSDVFHG